MRGRERKGGKGEEEKKRGRGEAMIVDKRIEEKRGGTDRKPNAKREGERQGEALGRTVE